MRWEESAKTMPVTVGLMLLLSVEEEDWDGERRSCFTLARLSVRREVLLLLLLL